MWRSRSSSRHCRIEQSNAMNAAVAPYARRIGRVKSFRPIRGPGARARPPPLAVGDSESRGCRTRPSDRDRGIRSASTTCARSPRHRKWRRNCFAWRVPARRPESLQDSAGLGRNQDPVVLSLQMYRSAAGNVLGTNSRQSSVGHSAQGFEFDYCGVILGNDLVWREDEGWVSNKADSSDNAILRRRLTNDQLRALLQHTYRVLLTQGMKGTFIYSTRSRNSCQDHRACEARGKSVSDLSSRSGRR